MNFELILSNKVFCRMFGLVVIEVMTPSGHLSNINEMGDFSNFVAFSQASKIPIFVPIRIGSKEKNSELIT